MEYHFSDLFSWTSGKPVLPTQGSVPVYGSNGIIGFTDKAKYNNKIILGRVGAYCGSVAYCPSGFNATDNTLITTCDTSKILYEFAYYLLKQYNLNGYAGGSAQPLITQNLLKHLRCDIPSIEEQEKIAMILSSYDSMIRLNDKRISCLEQIIINLHREWFVRFRFPGNKEVSYSSGIPDGWNATRVRDLVKRLPFGKLYKAEDADKEGKVIIIDQSTEKYVGFHLGEPSHIASIEQPIALFGDHSCKNQLMIAPFSLSENVIPYKAKEGIELIYLFFSLRGLVETTEYKRHWSELMAKKLLLAPYHVQLLFADKVRPIVKTINILELQNRNLEKQRDRLLPRLLSRRVGKAL